MVCKKKSGNAEVFKIVADQLKIKHIKGIGAMLGGSDAAQVLLKMPSGDTFMMYNLPLGKYQKTLS